MLFPLGVGTLRCNHFKTNKHTLLSVSISPLWTLIITEMDTLVLQPQRAPRLQDRHRNEPACQGKHLSSTPGTPIVNSRQIDLRLI